jgi:hypothetical protein
MKRKIKEDRKGKGIEYLEGKRKVEVCVWPALHITDSSVCLH